MTIFRSAEARWFFRGNADPGAEAWITSGRQASKQGERIDEYVLLPGCRSVGVKLREGRFEVKAATSASREFTLGSRITGRCQTWVKWSRPSNDKAAMQDDEQWAFVRKRRVLRIFSLASATVEEMTYGGPLLAAGCQVERTNLALILRRAPDGPPRDEDWEDSENWWTFGFEAFGRPDRIEGHLDRMLDYFAGDSAGITLPREASMSYPAWLAERAASA